VSIHETNGRAFSRGSEESLAMTYEHATAASGTFILARKNKQASVRVVLLMALFCSAATVVAQAPPQDPSQFDVTGFIQAATVNNPANALPAALLRLTIN
jgi:hypothetical protein